LGGFKEAASTFLNKDIKKLYALKYKEHKEAVLFLGGFKGTASRFFFKQQSLQALKSKNKRGSLLFGGL